MLKQKTLKDSFSLSGKGLHTGLDLTVTFNPAPDNHGYKIQRIDVEGQPIIDAVADNVVETTRGTVLSKNGVKVSTVEHGMAALYALGIDNCLIQVNGPEFPILDGSAQYYVQEIEKVGIEEQNAVKDFYIIKSKIEFRDEETGSFIIVLPDENFSLNVLVSYDSTIIPNQFATLEDMNKSYFCSERVRLRAMEPEDLEVMYAMENDSQTWDVTNFTVPYSRFVLKQYIENSECDMFADRQLRMMIVRAEDDALIGTIDITEFSPMHARGEVGIAIRKEYQGNGYAKEALRLLCDYVFSFLYLKQLIVHISVDNEASIRLFESCGFVRCGLLKEWWRVGGCYKDVVLLQLLRSTN